MKTETFYGQEFPMGPMFVRQPLPAEGIHYADPFVLLHHAAPRYYEPGKEHERLAPHPHRGFDPVTFVFEGGVFHRDSLGNEGEVYKGGVQWLSSGSGILHSEGPAKDFIKTGGELELIQLWVNVPAKHKMDSPSYQNIPQTAMPKIFDTEGVDLFLVSGTLNTKIGPALTRSDVIAVMGTIKQNSNINFPTDKHRSSLIYVLDGSVKAGETKIDRYHLGKLPAQDAEISISAVNDSKVLLLSGKHLNEPISTYGPFVMNSRSEIQQAYDDFHAGKFGTLDY